MLETRDDGFEILDMVVFAIVVIGYCILGDLFSIYEEIRDLLAELWSDLDLGYPCCF